MLTRIAPSWPQCEHMFTQSSGGPMSMTLRLRYLICCPGAAGWMWRRRHFPAPGQCQCPHPDHPARGSERVSGGKRHFHRQRQRPPRASPWPSVRSGQLRSAIRNSASSTAPLIPPSSPGIPSPLGPAGSSHATGGFLLHRRLLQQRHPLSPSPGQACTSLAGSMSPPGRAAAEPAGTTTAGRR